MNPFKKRKIQKTLQETKARRALMNCKVIECKVDKSTLSNSTLEHLNKLFLESKWLYNSIISSEDIGNYDTKVIEVPVKIIDKFENRKLEYFRSNETRN